MQKRFVGTTEALIDRFLTEDGLLLDALPDRVSRFERVKCPRLHLISLLPERLVDWLEHTARLLNVFSHLLGQLHVLGANLAQLLRVLVGDVLQSMQGAHTTGSCSRHLRRLAQSLLLVFLGRRGRLLLGLACLRCLLFNF